MAHGIALKQREIQVRTKLILDDGFMVSSKTGEHYAHNRAYRRKEAALGDKISKHEGQRRKPRGWWRARKARRKMVLASRRRTF